MSSCFWSGPLIYNKTLTECLRLQFRIVFQQAPRGKTCRQARKSIYSFDDLRQSIEHHQTLSTDLFSTKRECEHTAYFLVFSSERVRSHDEITKGNRPPANARCFGSNPAMLSPSRSIRLGCPSFNSYNAYPSASDASRANWRRALRVRQVASD